MIKKLVRFAIVGGLNTGITLGVFYSLYDLLRFNYLVASVIGYALGIVNSYIWNKLWTFESTSKKIVTEFSKFAVLNLTGLILNALLMLIFVELIHFNPFLSQVLTIGLIFIVNFLGSSLWVFKN